MPSLAAIGPTDPLPEGALRFFPNEEDPSPRLSPADVEALLSSLSPLYEALAKPAAAALAHRADIPEAAAAVIVRDPLVLLTYVFFDRLARMARWTERLPARGVVVPASRDPALPRTLPALRAAAMDSADFNQALLRRLADIWSLPAAPALAAPPAAARPPGIENLNFARPSLLRRALWKAARLSSRRFGRIPALGLSYAESCFLDAGLIAPGRLAYLHGALPPLGLAADAALREAVLGGAADACAEGIGRLAARRGAPQAAVGAYRAFLIEGFPASHLEEASGHLAACAARLRPFAPRPVLFSESGDLHTTYMLAAAKSLAMPVVGVQHGAHYSFCDAPAIVELEFAHCDRFLTWGPASLPDHPRCRAIPALPLPSPWLAERARTWRKALGPEPAAQARPFDVLLMTDRLQRFPPAPYTLRLSRIDFLPEAASWLAEVVSGLTEDGARVLHKPFNRDSADILSGTIARLRRESGDRYTLHEGFDKGMSAALLRQAALVLWDEPGTGLFECLYAGLPTMLLWRRDVSRETPAAEPVFAALERAGIVHREARSLRAEVRAFRRDPRAWMADAARAEIVRAACRSLAWTEDAWARRWREALAGL